MTDRGSAGVVLLAAAGAVAVAAAGLGAIGVLWHARTAASTAADAAALAAAPVTFRPFGASGSPAAEAARYAAANGARLVACACRVDRSWRARTVTVTVVRDARLPLAGRLEVRASASAEFQPYRLVQVPGRELPMRTP